MVLQLKVKKKDFISFAVLRGTNRHEGNTEWMDECLEWLEHFSGLYEFTQKGDLLTISGQVSIGVEGSVLVNEEIDTISGTHCEIGPVDSNKWYVKDLQSTNGTFLIRSGQVKAITGKKALLQQGDTIRLGKRKNVEMVVISNL